MQKKKYLLAKWLFIYNLAICMTCIDSAYVGNSTYTTACAKTIQYFAYTIYM